jgi:2-polyprenyl-3-methyl-5-hydroxy-6-metoxy-1,4-benzoquinol methylase
MQKEKTIQFWDDFYRAEQDKEGEKVVKEWIVQPSDTLFQCILPELITNDSICSKCDNDIDSNVYTYKVLEIGCGTSLLSDAMCKYWEHHVTADKKLHITATDVSLVCIEQQKKLQVEQSNYYSTQTILEYKVLNITESHPEFVSQYDMILDKGCLDTCLFRSKNTDSWIDIVLQNLHSWLKPPHGIYIIITPRSKIKHVRDYIGFDVTRTVLTAKQFCHGDLEPRSGGGGSSTTNHPNDDMKEERQYMYICCQKSINDTTEFEANSNVYNSDNNMPSFDEVASLCSMCGISYDTFCSMKGSKVCANDTKYWNRRWRGHLQHCKLSVFDSNNIH